MNLAMFTTLRSHDSRTKPLQVRDHGFDCGALHHLRYSVCVHFDGTASCRGSAWSFFHGPISVARFSL